MDQAKSNAILAYMLKQQGLMIKTLHGKEFICRRPVFKDRVFSPAQKQGQERFRLAGEYARKVMADPDLKAEYEVAAKKQGKPLRGFIMGDFMNSPSIEEVYMSAYDPVDGCFMVIRTADAFKVVNVEVAISTPTRVPIEEGPAMQTEDDPDYWLYTFTTDFSPDNRVRVDVTATDRAGNTTTRTDYT